MKEKKSIFYCLNNRESDTKRSGVEKMVEILKNEYDDVKHSVSTNLKHKIVYDQICLISNRNKKESEEKAEIEPFLKVEKLKEILAKLQLQGNDNNNNDKMKMDMNEMDEINEINENIECILVDLHKLGVIVFFNNDNLKETIITDPRWFNDVFKTIVNYGRRKIQNLIQKIYDNFEEDDQQRINSFSKPLPSDSCKKFVKTYLKKWKIGFNMNIPINKIWNEFRNESIVDKVSFHNCLNILEMVENKFIQKNVEYLLKNIKEINEKRSFNTNHSLYK